MFVGREKEMQSLKNRLSIGSASFVVIRGRRRIGKSRLIKEFSKEFPVSYLFTGLPPTKKVTKKEQRREFINQMRKQGLHAPGEEDWSDIFWGLSKACEQGPTLVALDEISWMGFKDPTFLGKLKVIWDESFERNQNLILIVASSISSWLDKNILNDTGFFGRIDLTMTLKELRVKDCVKFWGSREALVSPYEKLKILGVTGGVPKYLKNIDLKKTAEENIQRLCFTEEGLLYNEFDRIFHDLFSRRSKAYRDIVQLLVERHSLNQKEICNGLGRRSGSLMSDYLNDLVTAGFLSEDYSWDFKSQEISKLRRYRLSDNYLRFYLKYIAPSKSKIVKGRFEKDSLFNTLKWESIMGLQFENLVIHNSNDLLEILNITFSDCTFDGPYFQTRTKRKKGCQIDYLIQCRNTLYVCEIKFSKNPIGMSIIEEVKKKVESLSVPRLFSVRPVLIHVGGTTPELEEADYFDKIIDWTELIS